LGISGIIAKVNGVDALPYSSAFAPALAEDFKSEQAGWLTT
jgi:hypothetical protein